jgi:hypothetical protein
MKKIASVGLIFMLAFFGLAGCKKAGAPKAGMATAEDMLTMLPKDAQGIVVIDVHKAMTTEFVDKAIKNSKGYQEYQKLVTEIGVDPQKDVFYLALGITGTGDTEGKKGSGVGIINLKYNKDTLLAKIKEKQPDLPEQVYEGISIFAIEEKFKGKEKEEIEEKEEASEKEEKTEQTEKEGEETAFVAFLDESNIAAGTEKDVKAVIDIVKKKADNVFKNATLAGLIEAANKSAMVWSVFSFPPELMKDLTAKNPMLGCLAGLNALMTYFDYKNKAFQVEIKGMSADAEKNKQIADLLTGLKAMGGMAAAEKPEVGELMNKIEITSAPDHVKIFASLPEDLLGKLSEEAQKKVEQKLAETKAPEQKKEEK